MGNADVVGSKGSGAIRVQEFGYIGIAQRERWGMFWEYCVMLVMH